MKKQVLRIFLASAAQPAAAAMTTTPNATSHHLIGHLTFRSARLDTARTAATIQKRSVIFVSGRPWNWK